MNILVRICFTTTLVAFSSASTSAQSVVDGATAPAKENLYRARYEKTTDLPDAIAFNALMHTHDVLKERNELYGVDYVMQGLRVKQEDAEDISALLSQTLSRSLASADKKYQTIACNGAAPRAFGEQVFTSLEKLDDAQEEAAAEALTSFLNELTPAQKSRMMQWLTEYKPNVSHGKFNMKRHYDGDTVRAETTLASICLSLADKRKESGDQPLSKIK